MVVHSTIKCTPCEIVYGFNPLTPLDWLPMPPKEFVNFDANAKVEFGHKLHKHVKEHLRSKIPTMPPRHKIFIFKP